MQIIRIFLQSLTKIVVLLVCTALEAGSGIPFLTGLVMLLILLQSSGFERVGLLLIVSLFFASAYAASTFGIFITLWISWTVFSTMRQRFNRVTVSVFAALLTMVLGMVSISPELLQYHWMHPLATALKLLFGYAVVQYLAVTKWEVLSRTLRIS